MIMPPCGRWKTKRLIPLVRIAVVWYHYGKDDDMKRVLVLFLAVVFWVSCVVPFGANAVVGEMEEPDEGGPALAVDYTLRYWFVDAPEHVKIGRWTKSQIKVYVASQSTWTALSKTNMEAYVRAAFSAWDIPGKSLQFVSSADVADIEVYGITRARADALKIDPLQAGETKWGGGTPQLATYTNSAGCSEFKELCDMFHAIVYLIEDSSLRNSTTMYKCLASHEFGHALGYYGHYESGSLMKMVIKNVNTHIPGGNEQKHLYQLYISV